MSIESDSLCSLEISHLRRFRFSVFFLVYFRISVYSSDKIKFMFGLGSERVDYAIDRYGSLWAHMRNKGSKTTALRVD
jgi:hypothetical protein